MEQVNSGMSDVNDLPEDFPKDKEELGSEEPAADQLTADLLREQAESPGSLSGIPGGGEDVVLLVETISLPDESGTGTLSAEEQRMLEEMGMDEGSPWYRSPWFYMGASLVGGAALAAGAVLLLRSRKKQPRTTLGRAQSVLSQWSNQLGDQTGKLAEQASKLSRQIKKSSRRSNSFAGQMNKFTNQAQDQIGQLARRTQRNGLTILPLQRQSNASKWLKQTRHQLNDLSQQVGEQLTSLGSAIGATSTQALDRTQEGLEQIRQGVAGGVAKTGEGIQTGWKLSRNFTLGMAAGAVWAAVFTPQNGETTRQHLSAIFQRGKTRNR